MRAPIPALQSPARVATAAALALLATVVLRSAWLSDDAYFTFRTVEHLVAGDGPRWNVDERVQVYTHPLWMLCLSAVRALGAPVDTAAFALSLAATAGVAIGLAALGRSPAWSAAILLVLASSKAFVDFSTSGLESPLSHLLLVGFAAAITDRVRGGSLAVGLIAGALLLCRPDFALLVGPATAAAFLRGDRRARSRLALGLLPLVAWTGFALVYYGTVVPNPAWAKLHHDFPRTTLLTAGASYLVTTFALDWVTVPALAAFAALGRAWRPGPARWLWIGIALHLAWVVWIGGDFMAGRFLTPSLVAAAALVALDPPSLRNGTTRASGAAGDWRPPCAVAAAALALGLASPRSPLLAGPGYGGLDPRWTVDPDGRPALGEVVFHRFGVVDERGVYFQRTGLFRSSTGPRPRYGSRPPPTSERDRVEYGVAGTRSFESGRAYHCVDAQGLGDAFLARLLPQTGGDGRYRAGHTRRTPPPRYLKSLALRKNLLADDDLRRLFDDVRLVTAGPLFGARRWSAIVRYQRGLDVVAAPSGSGAARVPRERLDITSGDGRESPLSTRERHGPSYGFRLASAATKSAPRNSADVPGSGRAPMPFQ